MRRLAACFLFIASWAVPAGAGEVVLVSAVDRNGNLLIDDGRVVRPAGIAISDAAMVDLRDMVVGRRFGLTVNAAAEDRHGRIVAHLADEEGVWLQRVLLERGLAAVRTQPDDRARAAEMLAIEAQARAAGHGLWGKGQMRVREATGLARVREGFAIVEGHVHQVTDRQGRLFVNFTADWRTDFTILAQGPARQALRRAGLSGVAASGVPVRVRGWLRFWNGPMIEVDHAEQVEFLDGERHREQP